MRIEELRCQKVVLWRVENSMQILEMAFKNALHSKIKLFFISVLICFGMTIFTFTLGASTIAINQATDNMDELKQNNEMRILPRITGSTIAQQLINKIEKIEGVSNVLPQYNIYGLLEKGVEDPIYNVAVNGFDFDKSIMVGAEDYRGQGVKGILLPNLTVDLNGKTVLSKLVGQDVYFTYEYFRDGQIYSDTIKCHVIGTYDTDGEMESNPVYMIWDMFVDILDNKGVTDNGVSYLTVYTDSSEIMNSVSEAIEEMGLIVTYERTKQDYINFLSGFRVVGVTIGIIVLFLANIIIIQAATNNVRRREKAIGVLKVYGYSNMQISKLIIYELLIYCIIGLLLTFIICSVFDSNISNIFSSIMFKTAYKFNFRDGFVNVIICLILCVLSTVKPVIRCIRLNPIEVLKGE